MKDALNVGAEDLLPTACRKLLERRAPHDAGVVHEDVELSEPLSRGLRELLGALRCRHVARDRLAVAERGELPRGGLEIIRLARGDDHARTGLHEPARDHQPDPTRAARHERGLTGDLKQLTHRYGRLSALVPATPGAVLDKGERLNPPQLEG